MKRICIYWLCVAMCYSPATAADYDSTVAAIVKASETREDRLERRLATLEKLAEYMARQKFPTPKAEPKPKDVPPPRLSKPVVTYRWEKRARQVPYTVMERICYGTFCRDEPRTYYRTETYDFAVPVASSQHVINQPDAAASTPMADVRRMVDMVNLPPGSVILDPGTGGDARIAIELANRGYLVIAYEIDGARYRSAKKAIRDAGYKDGQGIKLVHGDVTKRKHLWDNVDGVVAYMYGNVLDSIAKKFKDKNRLKKFISYQHDLETLQMVRSGDIYVWTRPTPAFSYAAPAAPQRYAVWEGQIYHGDYNPNCKCPMCRSIRAQQGIPGR